MADYDPTDVVRSEPAELSVTVGERTFRLREEVALYGSEFSWAALKAWEEVCEAKNLQTAYNYWKCFRRFLRWVAVQGEVHPNSAVADLYRSLRDNLGVGLTEDAVGNVLLSYAAYLFDAPASAGRIRPKSRNKIFESTRSALQWFAEVQFLPHVSVSAKMETFGTGTLTPCIATLKRILQSPADKATASHEALAHDYVETNRQCLNRLRQLLVAELREEETAFNRGISFLQDTSLPSAQEVERAATALDYSNGTDVDARRMLHLDDPERHLAVLVKYIASAHGGVVAADVLSLPIRKLIHRTGKAEVIRHLEGTSRALNAAFHIILIDTGWNVQPCWDLPNEPFVSHAVRGRRRVSTMAAIKLRAGGTFSSAPLPEMEADLLLRDDLHGLSGIETIQLWNRLAAPIRERARQAGDIEAAEMLWILPSSSNRGNAGRVTMPVQTMGSEWWPHFRKRHRNDPIIGGLQITRRVIRQTKSAINAADNNFDFAIISALNNNSQGSGVAFQYLSPAGIRAMLSDQIRKFQDLLEAVIVQGLAEVAEKLGLDPIVLSQRSKRGHETGLGLFDVGQGLAEASASDRDERKANDSLKPASRENPIYRLVPTDRAIECLHLARIAFRERQSALSAKNPERWVRMWLPLHALVEAYCERLQQSRHRVRFEKIGCQVIEKLAAGQLALPYIW